MTAANPLAGYLRWHARDALLRACTPVILFAGMGGIPLWSVWRNFGFDAMVGDEQSRRMVLQIYGATMPLSMTLGAVIVASGLIATDREKQYFRFLFAKPVVAWRFYLQQFVVGLLMFALAMSLVPIGFSLLVTAVSVSAVVKSALLIGLLYGSLASLCGALVVKDGAAFVSVALLTVLLQGLGTAGQLPVWLGLVAAALPPLGAADVIRGLWLSGQPAGAGPLLHVVGYSLGMLVAALWLVRRLPLARS